MRSFPRLLTLCALTLLLGACATRGPLAVDCDRFPAFVSDLPYAPLEAQIRNNWPPAAMAETSAAAAAIRPAALAKAPVFEKSRLNAALSSAVAEQSKRPVRAMRPEGAVTPAGLDNPSVLLLSGGGQWGAFGAGLLTTLAADEADDRPNPVAITGVSTGALQMLFIGAGLEDPAVRTAFRQAYLPAKESEVVDRQGKLMAVVTGAMSGLKPLRKRLETALCPDEAPKTAERTGTAPQCPILDKLAASNVIMLAGFVEARSGRFQFADINGMAAASDLDARSKRSCIAGAALASVAMPVFFQQVKVAGKTYFDGGVRQSVFATFVQREIASQMSSESPLPLLVLRNGPTDMDADDKSNGTLSALTAALRAEAIIVNQVEVSSVASLRLQLPHGRIGFASADGWRNERQDPADPASPTCLALKNSVKDAQFVPAFMRCLMGYGDRRAHEQQVWLPLIEIDKAGGPMQPN